VGRRGPVRPGPIRASFCARAAATTADLEGRALDVVLRCGWPRPGDPLGIKPCIPIEVSKLKHLAEMIDAEDGRHAKTKLDELRTFIGEQLRMQRYVMALYVAWGAGARGAGRNP
jgi:hypothetical protein